VEQSSISSGRTRVCTRLPTLVFSFLTESAAMPSLRPFRRVLGAHESGSSVTVSFDQASFGCVTGVQCGGIQDGYPCGPFSGEDIYACEPDRRTGLMVCTYIMHCPNTLPIVRELLQHSEPVQR
jgi:hypothetical protein